MTAAVQKKHSSSKKLRYHLRFQIIPGKHVERDARRLVRFCQRHTVEEVVLFVAGEEWNNGLLSAKEEDMWLDTVKRSGAILKKAGIAVSLNPWMTALHCDRGRVFPKDRRFKPMVSPAGRKSRACASFADPGWHRYLYSLYGRFAKLGFRVMWVEDDFRYLNHAPLEWGCGFEPQVIRRFERTIGRKTTREEVLKNILKPGKPHPWRARWMETWREIHLEVARGLAKAVAENAPSGTKLGLMSSVPAAHSVEGRDWRRLFDALLIDGAVAHRPHYAPYGEEPGKHKDHSIMMLDMQKRLRPDACEVAPEVENWSFTNWWKSDTQTWAEMALCLFHGSDALLLDLFPFTGNPVDEEPQIGRLLDRSRPALKWIAARFSKSLETRGVGIPWREDAQAHVRTAEGRSLYELNASSLSPGHLLLPCGVPVSASLGKVNAIFGSLAWSFSDEELLELLSGGVLLDGESADILCRRGLGRHIGVDLRRWVKREEGLYSLEVIESKESGVSEGLYFSVNLVPRIAVLKPRSGATVWSRIITPERKRVGAGMVAYENVLGGRVVTFAVPDPASLAPSYHRQRIVQQAARFLSRGRFGSPLVTGGANLLPVHFAGQGKQWVVVLNGSPDAARPIVQMGGVTLKSAKATVLAPLEKPGRARVSTRSGRRGTVVTCRDEIPYLGFLILECEAGPR